VCVGWLERAAGPRRGGGRCLCASDVKLLSYFSLARIGCSRYQSHLLNLGFGNTTQTEQMAASEHERFAGHQL
jgi:hypothetical protein